MPFPREYMRPMVLRRRRPRRRWIPRGGAVTTPQNPSPTPTSVKPTQTSVKPNRSSVKPNRSLSNLGPTQSIPLKPRSNPIDPSQTSVKPNRSLSNLCQTQSIPLKPRSNPIDPSVKPNRSLSNLGQTSVKLGESMAMPVRLGQAYPQANPQAPFVPVLPTRGHPCHGLTRKLVLDGDR